MPKSGVSPEGETAPPDQWGRESCQLAAPVSLSLARFRRRFFPKASPKDWNDWHWQLKNRIRTPEQLERFVVLSPEEREALSAGGRATPLSVTPYYMSLVDPLDPLQPLRRCVIPTAHEQLPSPHEADDPLGEDADSPLPGLVHRYPDRVLLLATNQCSTYCRYCTRSRMVGDDPHHALASLDDRIAYIEAHREVRDVLVSGGDPLTMEDGPLEALLARLRRIPHVELLRIGTKVPAVLPQRITRELVRMLRRYHPLWLSLHFTHPAELTPETTRACERLADAGFPLGSQTVLLRGINDSVQTMRELCCGLLRLRVRPYYLYQCDPIRGSSHFRTPVEHGLTIIRGLRGFTTGYAVPTYVIDAPGGGGKTPLLPGYCEGRDGDDLVLRNYAGGLYRYPDPLPTGG
jgi:lysine 2,3-aminomutase